MNKCEWNFGKLLENRNFKILIWKLESLIKKLRMEFRKIKFWKLFGDENLFWKIKLWYSKNNNNNNNNNNNKMKN